MTRPPDQPVEPAAARLYRALIRTLPAPSLRRFEEEMVRLFRDRLADAGGARRRVVTVWFLAVADLLRHGIGDRLRRSARSGSGSRSKRPIPRSETPSSWRASMLDSVKQDLRHAVRIVLRRPFATGVIAATLALGIGSSTAMYALVDTVLLRPLPYPEADRLLFLQEETESGRSVIVSYPNFVDWRREAESFDALVATTPIWDGAVYNLGRPIPVRRMGVSHGFFRILAGGVALGRPIAAEEIGPGAPPAVVVSHRFWSRHLGADPDLEGTVVDFGPGPIPVVGVAPRDFRFAGDVDLWMPLPPIEIRDAGNFWVVGKLAPGVSAAAAQEEMSLIAARLHDEFPDSNNAVDVTMTGLRERLVGDVRLPLWALLGASTFVLLVACTNVAGTLLARGLDREHEIAIRRAVGAGRGRIIGQLLAESFVLAALGAVPGFLLAYGAVELLGTVAASRIPRLEEVGVEPGLLLFAVGCVGLTALAFGLFPALRLARARTTGLASRSRAGARRGVGRSWIALVSVEVGLALILLLGSGLLVRSLVHILDLDVGYDRDGVVTARFSLPSSRYGNNEQRSRFLERLQGEIAGRREVEDFGLAAALPVDTGFKAGPLLTVPYTDPEDPDEWDAHVRFRVVDSGYFDVLGIDLLQGRPFDERDRADAPTVAIVNRSLAEELWGGENPLGKRVRALWDFRGEDLEIVGVVAEARHWNRARGTQHEIYVPWRQRPEHATSMVAALRGPAPVSSLASLVRGSIESLDPEILVEVRTMDEILYETLGDQRFLLTVFALFSLVALILAVAGVYAVVSHSVANRTREIGIRIALGADPRRVRLLVGRRALAGTVLGLTVGLAVAVAASRYATETVTTFLHEIGPDDPLTYALVVALLLGAAALAAWIPSRRATRVDPVRALRSD